MITFKRIIRTDQITTAQGTAKLEVLIGYQACLEAGQMAIMLGAVITAGRVINGDTPIAAAELGITACREYIDAVEAFCNERKKEARIK